MPSISHHGIAITSGSIIDFANLTPNRPRLPRRAAAASALERRDPSTTVSGVVFIVIIVIVFVTIVFCTVLAILVCRNKRRRRARERKLEESRPLAPLEGQTHSPSAYASPNPQQQNSQQPFEYYSGPPQELAAPNGLAYPNNNQAGGQKVAQLEDTSTTNHGAVELPGTR